MLALRSFARALPRASFRASPIIARSSQRFIIAPRPSILSYTTPYKSFSTTRVWREAQGQSDVELSAKLESEYNIETEAKLPQDLEGFLADSQFQLEDIPGTENVTLTKQFGNETIKVSFSIADMHSGEDESFDEDEALLDEVDMDGGQSNDKRAINQPGGKFDIAPEDSIATSDPEDMDDEPGFPVHLSITIDKGAAGATNIIARAESGIIGIDYVHFYPKASLTDPNTTAESKEADNAFGGPPFANLDMELQTMYAQYLSDRGINERLANILPQYIDYKEQREYMKWLQDLKNFVDA